MSLRSTRQIMAAGMTTIMLLPSSLSPAYATAQKVKTIRLYPGDKITVVSKNKPSVSNDEVLDVSLRKVDVKKPSPRDGKTTLQKSRKPNKSKKTEEPKKTVRPDGTAESKTSAKELKRPEPMTKVERGSRLVANGTEQKKITAPPKRKNVLTWLAERFTSEKVGLKSKKGNYHEAVRKDDAGSDGGSHTFRNAADAGAGGDSNTDRGRRQAKLVELAQANPQADKEFQIFAESPGDTTVETSQGIYRITVKKDADDGKLVYKQSSYVPMYSDALDTAVTESIRKHENTIDISELNLPMKQAAAGDLTEALDAVQMKHPELFCLTREYNTAHYSELTNCMLNFSPKYKQTNEQYQTELAKFNAETDKMLARIRKKKTKREKIIEADRLLEKRITYTKGTAHCNDAYGAIVEGKALCVGYSQAFSHLMNKLGIRNRYRYAEDKSHIWNEVYLNGRWLTVDVTWNDSGFDELLTKNHSDAVEA